jgi:hypothetical protein
MPFCDLLGVVYSTTFSSLLAPSLFTSHCYLSLVYDAQNIAWLLLLLGAAAKPWNLRP